MIGSKLDSVKQPHFPQKSAKALPMTSFTCKVLGKRTASSAWGGGEGTVEAFPEVLISVHKMMAYLEHGSCFSLFPRKSHPLYSYLFSFYSISIKVHEA